MAIVVGDDAGEVGQAGFVDHDDRTGDFVVEAMAAEFFDWFDPDVDGRRIDVLLGGGPGLVERVELRFFAGLSTAEIGELMGVSQRTIERDLVAARHWLARAMR